MATEIASVFTKNITDNSAMKYYFKKMFFQ